MRRNLERWLQFSKLIVAISTGLFVFSLCCCVFNIISDSTIAMTLLTITGGIMASSFGIYANKHKFEEVASMKLEHAKQISILEYESLEKKLKLMRKYGFTESDISNAQDASRIDELTYESVESDLSYLNDKGSQAEQDVEFKTNI